jgi:diguanylate cyclase (GGDEF)-like protein
LKSKYRAAAVAYLSNISLRWAISLVIPVLGVLLAGTWLTAKILTDDLLNKDATEAARTWAEFLAVNVPDLEQIAAGELPSTTSLSFFEATRKAGKVFRFVIFNRDGYSQLVSDRSRIAAVDLSEFSSQAAYAAKTGQPVVYIRSGSFENRSNYVAEAFVPVVINGQTVATVGDFVDETANRDYFYYDALLASVALCGLTALAFGVPAIAWYRRTREKQQADRRIRFLAHHDVLTGLPNRARLIERLQGALAVLPSTGGSIAVHFIDIDYFKQVNDTFGHDGGDFLLGSIGRRLNAMTRIEDMVARFGGDEFVIVQTGLVDKAQAEAFAKRIVSNLSAPMYFKGLEICATSTIGVALAPTDGVTPERLLTSADLALYAGKTAGRNCIRFFAPEMDEAMQKRGTLEKILRDAVAHEGLLLQYQPVIEMSDRHLLGFEALVRLPAPDGTLIAPATFIPLAEELRLIDKIGAWVLREACSTAMSWPERLTVAVNLSPAQFASGSIEDTVAKALKDSGLEPHRLELEITETLLLANTEATMATLRKLKAMGVSIVMDDFGTGYSSLSYLWKFPFDKIKIDRSFMAAFEQSDDGVETVVKSIIALGREMKMRVTVEGVETAQQVDFLYDAHADQVQGFYFGKPVPASEIGADVLKDFRKLLVAGKPIDAKVHLVKSLKA